MGAPGRTWNTIRRMSLRPEGVTCSELATRLEITVENAASALCQMVRVGTLVRGGGKPVKYHWPEKKA
jgi:hypothetical protein